MPDPKTKKEPLGPDQCTSCEGHFDPKMELYSYKGKRHCMECMYNDIMFGSKLKPLKGSK